MKEILALMLALVLVLGAFSAFAEEDIVPFTPLITNSFAFTVEDWFATGYARAALTIFLMVETASTAGIASEDEVTTLLINTMTSGFSYVGRADNILFVIIYDGSSNLLGFTYSPADGDAGYLVFTRSGTTKEIVTALMDGMCPGNYYENDTNDMLNVLMEFNQ